MEKNPEVYKPDGSKHPIINCHVHTFTKKHVPKYLAKSILPEPLYRSVNLNWVFKKIHWWYSDEGPAGWPMKSRYKRWSERLYKFQMLFTRHQWLSVFKTILFVFLSLQFIDIICHWQFPPGKKYTSWWMTDVLIPVHHFLKKIYLITDSKSWWLNAIFIAALFTLFKSGRNLIWFVAKQTIKWLGKIPGKQTKEMFLRYLTIGRYTIQADQGTVLGQLERQYPDDTGFVILPMDMKYMDAGSLKEPYYEQLEKLATLKEENKESVALKHNIYPFVFIDPRRITEDPGFFRYKYEGGKIILENCIIKKYIEEKKFSGFKIYPALGYFPFDGRLLPLWKYAAENNIPVLTHCVRGPMYFRGSKHPDWDYHPVFKQAMGNGAYKKMLLSERGNAAFSANFTHPMNFLCLLKKTFLATAIQYASEKNTGSHLLKEIFGLDDTDKENLTVKYGLDNLKICFAHYGGGDEWNRYFEKDRQGYSNELAQVPYWGIDFLHLKNSTAISKGKPEQLWKFTDWYSIITSIMLQHPNVYADISYILHSDAEILPLLKQTLQNTELRKKVLYGTDFYVVRNHKSDKNMLADMMGGLSEDDFDQIARANPRKFLNL
jgi:predicted TIM-barrel fold metal-dependent hydrolase